MTSIGGYYISNADSRVMEAANRALVGPAKSNGPFVSYFRIKGKKDVDPSEESKNLKEFLTVCGFPEYLPNCGYDYDAAGILVGGAFEHKSPTGRLRLGAAIGEVSRKYDWFYESPAPLLLATNQKEKDRKTILPNGNDRSILYGIFSEMEFIDSDRCRYGLSLDLSVASGKPFWTTENQSIKFASLRGDVEARIITRAALLHFGPFVRLSFDAASADFENYKNEAGVLFVDKWHGTSYGTEILAGILGERNIAKHTAFRFQLGGLMPIRRTIDAVETLSDDNNSRKHSITNRQKVAVSGLCGVHSRIGNVWELVVEGGGTARLSHDYVTYGSASVSCEF